MKVCVSACLLGCNCKYNGGNNRSEQVIQFLKDKEIVAVCPEQLGGLSTPRVPAEIVHGDSGQGRVMNKNGADVDNAFRSGAALATQKAVDEGATLAVLKANSPSCGVHHVYDGTFSGKLAEGRGVFAELLVAKGVPVIDENDVAKADRVWASFGKPKL